ncbi:MAG: type II toxin-antitoxin system RatA family toxin [Pseudomonadota bacterium]|nr:type II toxin-antitoxin system RatA family toxin [Pseudomonadota bacterium]
MRQFTTSHIVAHSARDMFRLVADVDAYPEFLPLCEELTVRGRSSEGGCEALVADMTVAYKFFRETFTSRVTIDPSHLKILVEYLDGPFRHLENRWQFRPLSEEGCEVDFYIEYEFASRSMQILMGAMFEKAFLKFTTAFEARADEIYGTHAAPAQQQPAS